MRKILVFVPTRALSDTLSAQLASSLRMRRDIAVFGHHGSLSRERRERAEQSFAKARDAVLVATTTMEVGVDIGDVDLVTLVGAPPGTRSLLQRIGRAGRRIGRTRVLALPRSEVERAALASMLIAARDGTLEPEQYGRRWSVFVQQVASFVAQAQGQGRRRRDTLELAQEVWPETPPRTAESIVDALLDASHLAEHRGRFVLRGAWADSFDGGRGKHANFDSSGPGLPVVDASTGETIASVAQAPAGNRGLALGGQRWNVQDVVDGEILLKPERTAGVREGFKYSARKAPTGLEHAVHVRRGLGLGDNDAPILDGPDGVIWLHFGGSAYQALLCDLEPELHSIGGLAGLAVRGRPDEAALKDLAATARLSDAVDSLYADLEPVLAVGPYQRLLPPECRARVVADLIGLPAFRNWLATRSVWEMNLVSCHTSSAV